MKLAFYKAFCKNATLLDNVIGIATAGSYSHVEIVFDDGMFFSISPRENSIRFKKINPIENNCDIFDLKIDKKREQEIREICENMYNKKYHYIGALFSIAPFCIKSKYKTFCSKLCANILKDEFNLDDGCTYSPNELYQTVSSYK